MLSFGGGRKFEASSNLLLQAFTSILASFISGMIAAYLVERVSRR